MKVGILGGTFDPIHAGHLYLARHVLRMQTLDQVLLLIARRPPHKRQRSLAGPYHRFAMAALATQDDNLLRPCSWELKRPAPSYTIDALRHFRSRHPAWRLTFIAGSDSLRDLHSWRDYAKLLEEFSFTFVQRPGETVDLTTLKLPAPLRERITVADASMPLDIRPGASLLICLDAPDVSSTRLRQTLSSGGIPENGAVPDPVLRYARKFGLYETSQDDH
ncbi:MAG TPA: nicotinate (nicotinamide) nucleotide adenylyltransferase [Acidobacteriota bacterium]|nr:nicotinate (nicotinamide) nucleotide adenylyltransferase [Acidobacteriota bacterium]